MKTYNHYHIHFFNAIGFAFYIDNYIKEQHGFNGYAYNMVLLFIRLQYVSITID